MFDRDSSRCHALPRSRFIVIHYVATYWQPRSCNANSRGALYRLQLSKGPVLKGFTTRFPRGNRDGYNDERSAWEPAGTLAITSFGCADRIWMELFLAVQEY